MLSALRTRMTDEQGRLLHLPAGFDPAAYLIANPDVARAEVDPGQHYRMHGFREGRRRWIAGPPGVR